MPWFGKVSLGLVGLGAGLLGYLAWERANEPARRAPGDDIVASLRAAPKRRPVAKQLEAKQREPAPLAPREPTTSRPDRELEPSRHPLGGSPSDAGLAEIDAPPLVHEHAQPLGHRPSAPPIVLESPSSLPLDHGSSDEAGSSDESGSDAPRVRHVEYTVFSRWQHPGLCATDNEGIDVRDVMKARFRQMEWGGALLFLDPRLPEGAHERLQDELAVAEREARVQLSLQPPRPNVFAYQDTALLLAAACTNDDVVAYYDGDVHVVLTHADVSQSVIHEYTHHALQTAGIVGPAWAQEGIAMTVARETWWRQRGWLERVASRPFSIDAMEGAVPYTLSSEQALAFYVQAAAMVACAVHDRPKGLLGLVQALRHEANGAELEYELPLLAEPRSFRACAEVLLR